MTLQIIFFKIEKKKHTYLWKGHKIAQRNLIITKDEAIKRGQTSHFYTDKERKTLFKFFKTKKKKSFFRIFAENIDKYLWISSAAKEERGNKLLRDLGISVPKTYGIGFPLSTIAPYRCVYVQEYLSTTIPLDIFCKQNLGTTKQDSVFKQIFTDIQCMHRHNLLFRDMYPEDILVDTNRKIYWVDTRVKKITSNRKFNRLFNKNLYIFLDDLKQWGISEKDISYYVSIIKSSA